MFDFEDENWNGELKCARASEGIIEVSEKTKILVMVIIGSIIGGCIVYVVMTNSGNVNIVNFNFDEPETIDELKADLIIVGCDTMIVLNADYWHNIKWLSYNDALKLARKAKSVNIPIEGIGVAFSFTLDGESWGWHEPQEPHTPEKVQERILTREHRERAEPPMPSVPISP